MWENDNINGLSSSSLVALIENRVPAVRIEAFADANEIDALVTGLLDHACRTSSIKQITRLGISQYEQGIRVSKDNYFNLAKRLN